MLSRRSVRIKAMQHLYMMDRDKTLTQEECIKSYDQTIDNVFELFLFHVYTLVELARRAVEDAKKRSNKFIPTEEDVKFTPRLFTNPLIQWLATSKYLKKRAEEGNFDHFINADVLNRLYREFIPNEIYRDYLYGDGSVSDLDVVLELYRFCRKDDDFNDMMEDFCYCWLDDKSLLIGATKKLLKAIPADNDEELFLQFYPEKDKTEDLGKQLLLLSMEEWKNLDEIIRPVVENWDLERLAAIDLILLKMGVLEFLKFPTIHTSVTIVEYVELAKQYSTERSKVFINGILDRILNILEEKEAIFKVVPDIRA